MARLARSAVWCRLLLPRGQRRGAPLQARWRARLLHAHAGLRKPGRGGCRRQRPEEVTPARGVASEERRGAARARGCHGAPCGAPHVCVPWWRVLFAFWVCGWVRRPACGGETQKNHRSGNLSTRIIFYRMVSGIACRVPERDAAPAPGYRTDRTIRMARVHGGREHGVGIGVPCTGRAWQ